MKVLFTKSIYILFTAALAAGLTYGTPAEARGNNYTFDRTYGNIGKWRILHGKGLGDTCAAEQDNARVSLRLMYTEYTGDWFIGVPDYSDRNFTGGMSVSYSGSASINDWSDAVSFKTDLVNSWAMYSFQNHVLKSLQQGSRVELDTPRWNRQGWSLSGSSKAIAMLKECAKNQGKRPRRKQVIKKTPAVKKRAVTRAGSCPNYGRHAARNSNQSATVDFVDQSGNPHGALKVYWIDNNGRLVDIAIFSSNRASLNTYVGHSFVVRDRGGRCYGGVYTIRSGHNRFTVR